MRPLQKKTPATARAFHTPIGAQKEAAHHDPHQDTWHATTTTRLRQFDFLSVVTHSVHLRASL